MSLVVVVVVVVIVLFIVVSLRRTDMSWDSVMVRRCQVYNVGLNVPLYVVNIERHISTSSLQLPVSLEPDCNRCCYYYQGRI